MYLISFIISIILYIFVYCIENKYNCTRFNTLNLPLGFNNIIGPFEELIKGRSNIFWRMIFSLNTPYLFIILGFIITTGYIIYNKYYKNTDNKDKTGTKGNNKPFIFFVQQSNDYYVHYDLNWNIRQKGIFVNGNYE